MLWVRYTAGMCKSPVAMRLIGAVSIVVLGMAMLPNRVRAESCEVEDIIKAPSATTASNENFKKLVVCINRHSPDRLRSEPDLASIRFFWQGGVIVLGERRSALHLSGRSFAEKC